MSTIYGTQRSRQVSISSHVLIADSYADNHAENHADSSSTYTGHDSEMLSVFDPNYDSNSVLGA